MQTAYQYLEEVSRFSTDTLVRAQAHNAMNEWNRYRAACDQYKLTRYNLWDLLAGEDRSRKIVRRSNDQDQAIRVAPGYAFMFDIPIFAEAQDRRSRVRTSGAFVSGIVPEPVDKTPMKIRPQTPISQLN